MKHECTRRRLCSQGAWILAHWATLTRSQNVRVICGRAMFHMNYFCRSCGFGMFVWHKPKEACDTLQSDLCHPIACLHRCPSQFFISAIEMLPECTMSELPNSFTYDHCEWRFPSSFGETLPHCAISTRSLNGVPPCLHHLFTQWCLSQP